MEDVMKKLNDLYGYLQTKQAELRVKTDQLNAREGALEASEKAMADDRDQLAKDRAAVKVIQDVLAEKQKIAEKTAELKLATANLLKEQEKFEAYVKFKTNEITKLRQAVDAETEDIKGTRSRLMAEVKRVDEEKVNMRKQILDELAGKI